MTASFLNSLTTRWDGGLSALCLIGLATVATQGHGCADKTTPAQDVIEEAVALPNYLTSIGPNVVIPAIEAFASSVESLISELDAVPTDTDSPDLAAAQQAWKAVNVSWQQVEVLQLGPLGSSLSVVGGEDLRDEAYSWPLVNYCRLDQETTELQWNDDDFFEQNIVNVYGIDAIEYLLYGTTNGSCPSQVPPMSDGTWSALTEAEILANRLDYAKSLAAQLAVNAEEMLDTWAPSGGDFSGQLALAAGTDSYEDQHDALDAVYRALFYVETMTKDTKLAHPIGLIDCSVENCIEDLEGLLSGTSLSSVHANLVGARHLFWGGADSSAAGMDDLLIEIGHADLAASFVAALNNSVDLLGQDRQPLSEMIIEDPETVDEIYAAVKAVTDLIKNDLSVVLNVEIPSEAAGDND